MPGVSEPLIQASLLGEALDNGPVAVFVADEDRRFVAVNQAACRLTGHSRDELLALRIDDLVVSESKWDEMLEQGTIAGVGKVRCKDGTIAEFSYVAGATQIAGMPVYISVGVPA
jgi:PAS domain S-box-containing protein